MFNAQDIEGVFNIAAYALNCGKQGKIFRFAVLFASRFWRFCAHTEEVEDEVEKMDVFEVKQTPLLYSREHGNYLQSRRLERLGQAIEVEQAIYF